MIIFCSRIVIKKEIEEGHEDTKRKLMEEVSKYYAQ